MNYREELIGRNVSLRRGHLSQQAVAEQMRELGYKWSQATVWAIEKGDRPLRLAEASDLARVLGIHVTELLRSEQESAVLGYSDRTREAERKIALAVAEYMWQRSVLEALMNDDDVVADVSDHTRGLASRTLNRTIDDSVKRGVERWRLDAQRAERIEQERSEAELKQEKD